MNTTDAVAFGCTGQRQFYLGCEAKTCDGDGTYAYAFLLPAASVAYGCSVDTVTGQHGFRVGLDGFAVGCVVSNVSSTSRDGFVLDSLTGGAFGCTAYAIARSGFMINGNPYSMTLVNCLVYNCGASARAYWDLGSSDQQALLLNCAWGGTGSAFATSTLQNIGSITLSANPFVNAAAGNFALNGASGGGLSLRQAGFPTSVPFDANMAVGAIQWPDPKAFVHLASP